MALVKLKNVRINFASVFEPFVSAKFPNNEPKYQITLLLDKEIKSDRDMVASLAKACDEAAGGAKVLKHPLIDGDEPGQHENNAGYYLVRPSNKRRPVVVGKDGEALTEADNVIYDGCYCNVALDVYYYPKMKGVFATLLGVQFAGDGEPLGRRGYTPEDMF